MDCSLSDSSVHGILQAWILEWIAMPSSRGSSQPRNQTRVSYISYMGRWDFTTGANEKPRQQIKKQSYHFADIGPYSQIYGFSSSHVQMWVLVHKEDWAPKNWCFWTVLLENTLESPLDCKDIKAVNPKENQPWIFIGRIVAEAEAPILWPPDVKSRFIWKNPDAGKNWRQKENEVAEDKMVR